MSGGTESESLVIGTDFGIVTHIETGPNGHLFIANAANEQGDPNSGLLYEVMRRQ